MIALFFDGKGLADEDISIALGRGKGEVCRGDSGRWMIQVSQADGFSHVGKLTGLLQGSA